VISRQMRILHIEDNDDHAELVSAAITDSRRNSRVIRFSNAESGLDYLFRTRPRSTGGDNPMPDLIILDLSLPGMNGLEFLEHLRSNQLTAGIPVVVLTNADDPDKIDAVYRQGANSYVIKPVGYDEFVIKLAEMNMYWSGTSEVPMQGAQLQ
jgi:DNA-binding response OmpR family regulator